MQNILNLISLDLTIGSIHSVNLEHHEKGWRFGHLDRSNGRRSGGLVLVVDGSAEYCFDGAVHKVKKGDILYLRRGMVYDSRVTDDVIYSMIVVNFQFGSDAEANKLPIPWRIAFKSNPRAADLMDQLLTVWKSGQLFYRMKAYSILQEIFYELAIHCAQRQTGPNMAKIIRSVEYMEQNYAGSIHLDDLARLSNLSPSHFRKLFTEVYGVPPIEYLNHIRIEHAKYLIASRQYALGTIAERTGFNSPQYFSRTFKAIVGLSPREYNSD